MKTNHAFPTWLQLLGPCLLVISCVPGSDLNCCAQRSVAPRKLRVVDEVALKTGVKLFGIVRESEPGSGIEILVDRQWYAKTYPKRYAAHRVEEIAAQSQAKQDLLIRLEQWKATRNQPIDEKLNRFIDAEIQRLGMDDQAAADKDANNEDANNEDANDEIAPGSGLFIWVRIPTSEVRKVYQQTPERHLIANLAWAHKIKGVSVRSYTALTRELAKQNVKANSPAVDLSTEYPARPQTKEEWSARVSICEFVLRKSLHFQGIGSMLTKVDPDAGANQAGMLQQLLQGGGMQAMLENLLGNQEPDNGNALKPKEAWWKSATDAAEQVGCRGIRITRLAQDLTSPIVKVEEHFLAEISRGKWKSVFSTVGQADRDKIAKGDADFLKQDPQVGKIVGALGSLGAANNTQLDKALRQGVATQRAMENAEASILDFIDDYSQHVDGPPLIK